MSTSPLNFRQWCLLFGCLLFLGIETSTQEKKPGEVDKAEKQVELLEKEIHNLGKQVRENPNLRPKLDKLESELFSAKLELSGLRLKALQFDINESLESPTDIPEVDINELLGRKEEKVDIPTEPFTPGNLVENPIRMVAYDFEKDIRPALQKYCYDCHDGDLAKGDLNIPSLLEVRPLIRNKLHWVNVMERIRLGDMPPKDKPQPSGGVRAQLVSWLNQEIHLFDYSQYQNPGYEPTRRLTHAEYANTVRDLFGMPGLDPAADFPKDLSGTSGFKNSANSLFLQTTILERYIGAASDIVGQVSPQNGRVFRKGTPPEKQLWHFAIRAFRRPPTKQEMADIHTIFLAAKKSGKSEQSAIRECLQMILISPAFLFKSESGGEGTEYRIDAYGLINRLSYFLWASMPDDELFRLAWDGSIWNPGILGQQVARMLSDPRSKTLGSIFAAQWLGFEGVGTRVRLDPIDNPWCTPTLMKAMRDESALFFHSLVQENQPITSLIDARYSFLNAELAKHYRMRRIEGTHMRRVSLESKNRGGIFGHASVLAATSFPGRTSPVVRGKWILDTVLGTPPPPPPPDVGELDSGLEDRERLTFRQKLAIHSRKASCAGCHAKIDPLGFSLENYDHFGRYRTRVHGRRVDATGQLPDGTTFQGIEGLRQVILHTRKEELATQLTRKLLAYALGRQLEYYDEPAVQKIVAKLKADEYRFHTLVEGIVQSYPFQYKRPDRTTNGHE